MNYKKEYWTSDLIIQSDVDYDPDRCIAEIEMGLEINELGRRNFSVSGAWAISKLADSLGVYTLREFVNYKEGGPDYTALIKALAIKCMSEEMLSKGSNSHVISFGGDILVHNKHTRVRVTEKFYINLHKGCVFTSNNNKRPGHIHMRAEGPLAYDSVTVISGNPIIANYTSTSYFSQAIHLPGMDSVIYTRNESLALKNQHIYCASPFFTKEDKDIRDLMIKPFEIYKSHIFRPDQTDASQSYSISPGTEMSGEIFKENMEKIEGCDFLLFPKRTKDLGTLFEVGHALSLGKRIISYDNLTGIYELIDNERAVRDLLKVLPYHGDEEVSILIHLNSPGNAILLGYLASKPIKTHYLIPEGMKDNIMLQNSFIRLNENHYIVKPDFKEVL